MTDIHPTAIIDANAEIGAEVVIGPYCTIGPNVRLADQVVLDAHCVVTGHTEIGARVRVYPFAAIGTAPQDIKYAGEESHLQVGADTVIREHVTMNPGTQGGGMQTRVGERCLLMVGAHVAHDCRIGDDVILANQATLAGHVSVGDGAVLGGLSAVHQFVRIGRGAMIGGMTGVEHDVIPYGMALGNRARLNGLNIVGLKRRGVARTEIQSLRDAYQTLFDSESGTFQERVDRILGTYSGCDLVEELLAFIRAGSSRPLCHPAERHGG